MLKFEEIMQQTLEIFKEESYEKVSEWDGAIIGSLRAALHYYETRKAAFNDISGAKVAKAEAEKAIVEARNAQQQAQEEQAKAEKAKAQAEVKLAELAKAKE
jgi:hypothetical protein